MLPQKKAADEEKMASLVTKMSAIADEINCLLTKDQATDIMPFFVNYNMRERSCGSADFPDKAIFNAASVLEYKNCIKKLEN